MPAPVTGVLPAVGAVAGAADAIFTFLNTKESNKYRDEMIALRNELQDQRARGPARDDGRIMWIHGRLATLDRVAADALLAKLAS